MASVDYFLFVLSVTLTTLGLLFLGSIARSMKSRRPAGFKKKLLIFPLFIAGIFLIGWATERIQQGLYTYLQQNAATSISGIVIALLVAWLLYDIVIWRRKQ